MRCPLDARLLRPLNWGGGKTKFRGLFGTLDLQRPGIRKGSSKIGFQASLIFRVRKCPDSLGSSIFGPGVRQEPPLRPLCVAYFWLDSMTPARTDWSQYQGIMAATAAAVPAMPMA